MASTKQKPELLVIVGPTASGKSELAIKVAREFSGEIIAADSRTVYKGMDVGTSKPSSEDQAIIPHWGLDLVEPGEIFSAFKFKNYAERKIKEIQKRGNFPVLVGGTGLYVDSILFDYGFVEASNSEERNKLEELAVDQLKELIKNRGYSLPENSQNRRHLIRTIERKGESGSKRSLKDNMLIIGLMPDAEELRRRINARSELYFAKGLREETELLLEKYGHEAIKKTHGIAYVASMKALGGELNEQEAKMLIQKHEWQYARRQRTWFRRNKFIRWYGSVDEADKHIESIMNN